MRIFAFSVVVLFSFYLSPVAQAGMEGDCLQQRDFDLKVAGCTAMIDSGQYSGMALAIAYKHRAHAYARLDKPRQAIRDYDEALLIDSANELLYQRRGDAYGVLGEYERAAVDWEQAIRIDGAPAIKWWQAKLKMKGHYAGAVDGIVGPGTRRGLVACARDPSC